MQSPDGVLPINEVVKRVIKDLEGKTGKGERISKEDIEKSWGKAVGRFASKRSRPTSLKKGRLVVNVEDSSLLYNLTLRKREIIKTLAKDLKDRVCEIQFRIGEV